MTVNENPRHYSADGGILFVVGTPIGNLEDITLRALRILKDVNVIAAEDTRHTRKLLSHYDIHTPLVSYHEHNKRSRIPLLISRLGAGERIALVSDAGMPGISDPGHELIVAALEGDIEVTVVPGASALISALVVSGLPTNAFTFSGFPPRKAGERADFMRRALASGSTTVFFESPKRLVNALELIERMAPGRRIAIARELTKKFEEVIRGDAAQLLAHFAEREPRGECVVILEGSMEPAAVFEEGPPPNPAALVHRLMQEKRLSRKEAMREVARRLNLSRRDVYEALLKEEEKE
ncbi:MAG: 16S rRNA (cytidine(1402)-2'-O)-methyltransferase [Candidatus Abyssobacteria bacterium SURF_5]|uniref:Ribosomal RNA small subunit methyltransferase I n=1 Tax=Abyssobacteria bacterium (strain SURF_5) TaxID=2093360 RepID=A0A3A4P4F7_ABYX5|nr:MAG: 16S rRNA (cytidine(1402)-2'-O)-methyltransferase [Candidatus Abyssubacteria bacterium SURF_5]